jgi:glucan 1,3-beta-glucosidase
MSANEQRNTDYDPLPLTHDETFSHGLYNAPPSPDPHISAFHTPQYNPSELGVDSSSIPQGAAPPRFLGAALYDDPGAPRIRDSYASSHNTLHSGGNGSEYTGSVYALNDTLGATPLTHGPYSGAYRDDPHDSFVGDEGGHPMSPIGQHRFLAEKHAVYAAPRTKSKRKIVILASLAVLILLLLAVLIPVYFLVIRPKSNAAGSDPAHPTETGKNGKPSVAAVVTGGDGSIVTTDGGSTFTYHNSFGGYWYWDENDPFNNGARAQSWSPALNETFSYGTDKIRGLASFFGSSSLTSLTRVFLNAGSILVAG